MEYNNLKNQNCKGLIIDLRDNGGGIVTEAVKIADYIVEKGKCLLITSNKQNKEKKENSKTKPIVDVPVIFLINEHSASASEILVSSVKANDKCKVVGKKSYGKGVIQSVYLFQDGSGLKFTTEEYFSPNHDVINKVGITPDIEVDINDKTNSLKNIQEKDDNQLQEALKQLN